MPAQKRISLKDSVYKQILDMICYGELRPNVIFSENQMIERFRVSKTPIREALVELCHEGALESIPRCGYRVVEVSTKNIRDITELRMFLELSSLRKVEQNINRQTLELLRENLNGHRTRTENRTMWSCWQDNINFHLALNGAAGNLQVQDALERVFSTCTRAFAQLYAAVQGEILVSVLDESVATLHDRIFSALVEHNLFDLHECLKQDILYMEQQLLGAGPEFVARD